MGRFCGAAKGIAALSLLFCAWPALGNPDEYRDWIEEMKQAERGPFARLRWFCQDGSVLPPQPYACREHGGGNQHGEWSDRVVTMRGDGYYVANLLAGVDSGEFLAQEESRDRYAQLVIEKFLLGADDGWIFRKALFYRGAIQEEDERGGANALLTAMAGDPFWSGPAFGAWRTGAKLLPHGRDNASIDDVRQHSAALSDRDPGFRSLRAKIHGAPDASDAERVRQYAMALSDSASRADYEQLAGEIEAVYAPRPLGEQLHDFLEKDPPLPLRETVRSSADSLAGQPDSLQLLALSGHLMAALRDAIPAVNDPGWRLAAMDLGLDIENHFFVTAAQLRQSMPERSRAEHLRVLSSAASAAYGAGLINSRLRDELSASMVRLAVNEVTLADYMRALALYNRVPGWATQTLRMYFFESMQKLADVEPLALRFVQDQLRGSSLLLFSDVLSAMSNDSGQLAGVRHKFFGTDPGMVFTGLNPGIARGFLHVAADLRSVEDFRRDGVYVLPETVSDLPPVSGIITAGEGNPLSHVQLLARNLGIPNTTVQESFLPQLREHEGDAVVLAVSRAGLIEIAADGSKWDDILGGTGNDEGAVIRPDLQKLDLDEQDFVSLDALSAADSGRIVGPKAAKLGELRRHYPEAVSRGVAIPFGIFKRVALDQAHPGDGSVYEWMQDQYRQLGPIDPADDDQASRYEAFRAELYDLIRGVEFDERFETDLFRALESQFDGDVPGLFVRSDTNVEDLAGFTGAGLNLTLPNVVGRATLLDAIREVWASPFTARAFAWRQSHMALPEHVYTSILLLQSVASDKSGVLVTQDIDTGSTGTLSVAVNEGLGGAVDGQAAESLRIDLASGQVQVLATATAPWRRVPDPAGGLEFLPASGSSTVLQPAEIRQLIQFAESLPARFPPIVDDDGNRAPADVEFGFVDGELQLFQLRPFLESRNARGSDYLASMDRGLADTRGRQVRMNEAPLR